MTGLERNADVVHMCTYAPLFAHVDAWQWRPDLIWFDNLSLVKTPNYYVQQLYGRYSGSHVLSLTSNGNSVTGQDGLYASATMDEKTKTVILKIVNVSIIDKKIKLDLKGIQSGEYPCMLTKLSTTDLRQLNTLDVPSALLPGETGLHIKLPETMVNIPGCSFLVYSISL